MSRPWKERTAVYTIRVCEGFKPTSVCQWPETFTEARLYVRNVSLTDARAMVRAFNKAAMQRREADVPAWDRQWAIAGCCVRAKGRDRERLAARPDNQAESPLGYTSKEVERLLAACHEVCSKDAISPDLWWRGFVAISLATGLHPGELLEIKGGGLASPWTHNWCNWQSLCKTFRQTLGKTFRWLAREAEVDPNGRKGGAA